MCFCLFWRTLPAQTMLLKLHKMDKISKEAFLMVRVVAPFGRVISIGQCDFRYQNILFMSLIKLIKQQGKQMACFIDHS